MEIIETEQGSVRVPDAIVTQGGAAVDAYVAAQLAPAPEAPKETA